MKKFVIGSAVFLAMMSVANANGSFYFGPSLILKNTISSYSNARQLSPRFSLGYGGLMSEGFYLAGEIFGMAGTIKVTNYTAVGANNVKNTNTFGFSIIPGIQISEYTIGYLRIGAVSARFPSVSKNAMGGQLGLGLQTSLTQAWDLRGEYVYTAYRSLNGIGSAKADWFGVGLIYKFD